MLLHRHFEQEPKRVTKGFPPVELFDVRANAEKKPAGFKAAVYAGTSNLYRDMTVAAKSLFANSDVDKVFFLVEDNWFPYDVCDDIECINIRGQQFFNPGGPNFNTHWTYMVLMRAALTKIFPDLDRVLSLDVDTIVEDDISDLWNLDMGDCVVAMVPEYMTGFRPFGPIYWNAGVMLQDMAKLRETGLDDQIIYALNHETFRCPEQCAFNKYCAGRIYTLPTRYNDGIVCGMSDNPAIAHFVGARNWQTWAAHKHNGLLKKYADMSWEEVLDRHKEHCKRRAKDG